MRARSPPRTTPIASRCGRSATIPIEPPRDLWARTAAGIEREAAHRGRGPLRVGRPATTGRSRFPIGALSGIAVVVIVVGATALSGGWLDQPTVAPTGSPVVAGASQGVAIVTVPPAATPMVVAAGNVGWVHSTDDGAFAYTRRPSTTSARSTTSRAARRSPRAPPSASRWVRRPARSSGRPPTTRPSSWARTGPAATRCSCCRCPRTRRRPKPSPRARRPTSSAPATAEPTPSETATSEPSGTPRGVRGPGERPTVERAPGPRPPSPPRPPPPNPLPPRPPSRRRSRRPARRRRRRRSRSRPA